MDNIDYEAEYDAETLIRAEKIKSDKNRLSRAEKAIDNLKKKTGEELKLINKLSSKSVNKKPKRLSNNSLVITSNGRYKPLKISR